MIKYLILLLSAIVLILAYFFNDFISEYFAVSTSKSKVKLLTTESLALYNGIDHPELYLAILGNVYDVSKGARHYGAGTEYNFFVGKDASRSFITGNFKEINEDLDKVADLSDQDLLSIKNWMKFYRKEYSKVGKLIGRYYDKNGNLTPYGKQVKLLIKQAEAKKQSDFSEKLKYPPCNIEWDQKKGTRYWCTNKSGGIERSWIGFPRQFYEPGSKSYRCACVELDTVKKNTASIKEYENCDAHSATCYVKVD